MADLDQDADLDQHTVEVEPGGSTGRTRRVAPYIAGAIAIVVFALFIVLMTADTGRQESAASPLIGNVAPDAHGELADGATFDLSHRKGSWVVLNFFDPECIPCMQEHPELIEFAANQEQLGSDGAELYSVIVRGSENEVGEFFDERGGDWPQIYSEFDDFPVAFGVAAVPETWIIDPSGVVQLRLISKVTSEQLDTILQQFREQYQ